MAAVFNVHSTSATSLHLFIAIQFVVRILFMVPIFSMEAWFSLFFHEAYEYIGVFRELYEAFVLSSFVYYIIALLGGEDELVTKLRRKDATYGQHPLPFKMFLGEWKMGRQFMMNCKYGVVSLLFFGLSNESAEC